MAEQSDKIVCSICLGDFTDPKLLDCHHSFCCNCLQDYVDIFAVNNQFPCPLCRRNVIIPDEGVKHFTCNFYIHDRTPNTGESQGSQQLCDVCKKVNCNAQCSDCDKLLCYSCNSIHDIFYASNNHNVKIVKDLMKTDKIQTKKKIQEECSDSKPKDLCCNHGNTIVEIYCKDCSVAMCSRCFIKSHNGHQCLDLKDELSQQEWREEFKTLKDELKNHISRFETFSHSLEVKVTEVLNMADEICSQIDERVEKVYDEIKGFGEKAKVRVNNWRNEERDKLMAMNKEIQVQCEKVEEKVDNSDDVLKDISFIQLLQILPDIRQVEAEQSRRKLDIPHLKSVNFLDGKIDSQILSQQVGHVEILERLTLQVGQTFCFTTTFNTSQLTWDVYYKSPDNNDVIPWSISVCYYDTLYPWYPGLDVNLKLGDITDKSIKQVNVNYTYKLINNTNDSQSVTIEGNTTISPGGTCGGGGCIDSFCISDKPFNIQSFLDKNRNFKIQTTLKIIK